MSQAQQPRVGRPPISDEETLQINVRLPKSYLDWLTEEAAKGGATGRTAIIRRLIAAEMKKNPRR